MLIDTHAHLSFSQFEGEISQIIERAKEAGVTKIINVGCDFTSCQEVVELLKVSDMFYATLGLHPYEAMDVNEQLLLNWRELIANEERIVAIGEIGLDYFKAQVSREEQKRAFKMQLELAVDLNMPVVVHNRESDDDCLEILEEVEKERGKALRVVFHCYASDLDFARRIWEKGYFTSFTGVITYPNASDLREVVKQVPDELFMVETDCPYLAPQKYRGQRNEPAYVKEVAEMVAEVRGMKFGEVCEVSTRNASKFFGL